MKKTILFSFLLPLVFCAGAQVTILSKYAESFTLDSTLDEYVSNEDGGLIDIYFMHSEDAESISVKMEGEDEVMVIMWEYLPDFSSETEEAYITEDEDFVIFDYENRIILWYYEYNETLDDFESLDVMSEFEITE